MWVFLHFLNMKLSCQTVYKLWAFTLLEMIVVLMILAIMMMGIMTISWWQIDQVRANYELTTIQQILYDLHGITQRSNIYQWEVYTNIQLQFQNNTIQAANQSWTILLSQTLEFQTITTPITIRYQPYILGCTSNNDEPIMFTTSENHTTCFILDINSCKFLSTPCDAS